MNDAYDDMTLHDLFMGLALAGFASNGWLPVSRDPAEEAGMSWAERAARHARQTADELMTARKKS